MPKEDTSALRVAIIGAGFAGLALANVLEQRAVVQQNDGVPQHDNEESLAAGNSCDNGIPDISYRLFESKSHPIPIIGTIRLPYAKEFLQRMDMMDDAVSAGVFPKDNTLGENDSNYTDVSREIFLDLLRKNLKMDSGCRIIDVRCQEYSKKGAKYAVVTDDGTAYGDFDLVVLADGLFGEKSLLQNQNIAARIGDCHWFSENLIWWDFGTTRIRQGANTAIRDAMKLGQLLLRVLGGDRCNRDWRHLLETFAMPSSASVMKRKQQRAIFLGVLCPAIVAAVFFRILSTVEMI
jgi:hypothetical protein